MQRYRPAGAVSCPHPSPHGLRRRFEPAGRSIPDGVHPGIPHRAGLSRRRPADVRADRQRHRPAATRSGGAPAGPSVVDGDGGDVRRRRRHGHGPVVRDGPPLARADGPVRRRLRAAVRGRGPVLLPRGDLHRDLHLRLAPALAARTCSAASPPAIAASADVLGRRGERLDEPAGAASSSGPMDGSPR